MLYFSVFIKSCQKSKDKEDKDLFIDKLKEDEEYLNDNFFDLVSQSSIVLLLKPFADMQDFLNDDGGLDTSKICKNLRQAFGKAFTAKSVVFFFIIN